MGWGVATHGCTVGYFLPRLRRWGWAVFEADTNSRNRLWFDTDNHEWNSRNTAPISDDVVKLALIVTRP